MTGLGACAGLSKKLVFRDKSVKTLQYCCRFLIGYYGASLKPKSRAVLATVVNQCSQGRKVFRLLKSVNMLQSLVAKSGALTENSEDVGRLLGLMGGQGNSVVGYKQLAKYFEYLEIICIGIYFGFDNILFLGRSTIIPQEVYDPQALKWERATFSVWLANDISCFIKLILRITATNIEIQRKRDNLINERNLAATAALSSSAGVNVKVRHVETSDIDKETLAMGSYDYTTVEALNSELQELYAVRRGHGVQLFKNLCDLGVSSGNLMMSSEDTAAYRWWDKNTALCKLLGKHSSIGVLGALSSLADIYTML
jgi:hypothetical protein